MTKPKKKRKAKSVRKRKTVTVTPNKMKHDDKLRDWMGHDISEVEGY